MLSKVKNSPPQVEARSLEDRQSNVLGSFECRLPVEGLTVLLIDDVATTGSTLSECAATLNKDRRRESRPCFGTSPRVLKQGPGRSD